jgi:hypothetical protein
MITPSMTGTSARDESRCGAAEEFEAAPVKAEGDNPTKNTTENLEDLFDKQLNLICDFVNEMLSKQTWINQEQRAIHQAQNQPEMVEEGRSEMKRTLDQVSGKGILIEALRAQAVETRKLLTVARRAERQYPLEARRSRNELEIGEMSRRVEEEQERIEQRRRENEGLQ